MRRAGRETFQSPFLNGLMNRVTWDLIGATLKESDQSSLPSFVAVLDERRAACILTFLSSSSSSSLPSFFPPMSILSAVPYPADIRRSNSFCVSSNEIIYVPEVVRSVVGIFITMSLFFSVNRETIINSCGGQQPPRVLEKKKREKKVYSSPRARHPRKKIEIYDYIKLYI